MDYLLVWIFNIVGGIAFNWWFCVWLLFAWLVVVIGLEFSDDVDAVYSFTFSFFMCFVLAMCFGFVNSVVRFFVSFLVWLVYYCEFGVFFGFVVCYC